MEEKVEVKIIALSNTVSSSETYAVILEEAIERKARRLPIVIGTFDAQQLAVAIEKMHTPTPIIHEIFINFIEKSGYTIKEVVISSLVDGMFSSTIYFENKEKEQIELSSKVSDALTLATRLIAPIFVKNKILDEAGVLIEVEETGEPEKETSFFEKAKKLFGAK